MVKGIFYFLQKKSPILFVGKTRPKPVGHGYFFSMPVGTIWEWSKVVFFFLVRVRTVDSEGGWQF